MTEVTIDSEDSEIMTRIKPDNYMCPASCKRSMIDEFEKEEKKEEPNWKFEDVSTSNSVQEEDELDENRREEVLRGLRLSSEPKRILTWEEIKRLVNITTQGKIDVKSWDDLRQAYVDQGWSLKHVHMKMLEYVKCDVSCVRPSLMNEIWLDMEKDKENLRDEDMIQHTIDEVEEKVSQTFEETIDRDRMNSLKYDPERYLTADEVRMMINMDHDNSCMKVKKGKNWGEAVMEIDIGFLKEYEKLKVKDVPKKRMEQIWFMLYEERLGNKLLDEETLRKSVKHLRQVLDALKDQPAGRVTGSNVGLEETVYWRKQKVKCIWEGIHKRIEKVYGKRIRMSLKKGC